MTTLDFDFLFRKTPRNLQKLKAVAKSLNAVVFRPYYPASELFRVVRDDGSLQLDFMPRIHGVKSLASLRSRALRMDLGGCILLVAGLADIVKSKRAAGRPQDRAVLDVLERTLLEKKKNQKG